MMTGRMIEIFPGSELGSENGKFREEGSEHFLVFF